jgi:hypothetical protein
MRGAWGSWGRGLVLVPMLAIVLALMPLLVLVLVPMLVLVLVLALALVLYLIDKNMFHLKAHEGVQGVSPTISCKHRARTV